jgi:hypothetical protein
MRMRTAAAHSEGGGVEVDDGGAIVYRSLRKRMAAACSEASVEAAACSEAGDKATTCSGAKIEDSRRWHDDV